MACPLTVGPFDDVAMVAGACYPGGQFETSYAELVGVFRCEKEPRRWSRFTIGIERKTRSWWRGEESYG